MVRSRPLDPARRGRCPARGGSQPTSTLEPSAAPEAQPGWQGSCICRKITLCLADGCWALPRQRAPLLSGFLEGKAFPPWP